MSFDLKVFQKFILNNLDRQAKYDIFTSKCIDNGRITYKKVGIFYNEKDVF